MQSTGYVSSSERASRIARKNPSPSPSSHSSRKKVRRETNAVASLTDKLAEAKQALEDEALRRAQLETQLQASARDKTVREDEMAIRRMYEDLTGFTVTEVTMHDASQSSRRFEVSFTGPDYFGMHSGTHTQISSSPSKNHACLPRRMPVPQQPLGTTLSIFRTWKRLAMLAYWPRRTCRITF